MAMAGCMWALLTVCYIFISNAPVSVFPQSVGAGIPRVLDEQEITSPGNLTEHFGTGMGP